MQIAGDGWIGRVAVLALMTILDEIIQHKKEEVAKARKERPLSDLFAQAKEMGTARPFAAVLKASSDVAIIAEVKKASPSAGLIREDFNHAEIAKDYQAGGATAISVLTDEYYFQGHLSFLRDVRNSVDLPLLRKDFTIDPYQILEAKVNGADAILLIVSALSKDHCLELASAAREFRVDFLVEVHDVKELEFVLEEGFALIGINNRDLKSFSVDLATTEKLSEIIPAGVTAVGESGIKSREDIERLSRAHIDAVLIGETFMRQTNIEAAVSEFCGIKKCLR